MSKYINIEDFIKEYVPEEFQNTWGITNEKISENAEKLFNEMNILPSDHKEYENEVDEEDIPCFVLDRLISKYVFTVIYMGGNTGDAYTFSKEILEEYLVMNYIKDG